MRIVVVDTTHEGQAALADRINAIQTNELDALNLSIGLSSTETLIDRAATANVLLIGPRLKDYVASIAEDIKKVNPFISIILFVTDSDYRAGAFKLACGGKIRKVLSLNSSHLDLLQELSLINEELRRSGKIASGHVTVILQPKGGLGVTTATAALAEANEAKKRNTIVWDLDAETRDLSRAFLVQNYTGKLIREWLDGTKELNRQTFQDALYFISPYTKLIGLPDSLASAHDFMARPDSSTVAIKLVSLARSMAEHIIIDTAGHLGPTVGALLLEADSVLIAVDDSPLGMSAASALYEALEPVLERARNVQFLRCGTRVSAEEIGAQILRANSYKRERWQLPAIPFEQAAAHWAGSGKSIYSLGQRATKESFNAVVDSLVAPHFKDDNSKLSPAEEEKQSIFSLTRATHALRAVNG